MAAKTKRKQCGQRRVFLSLEDPPDDSHAEEELDECPGTLRECAVAGANICGGAEMLRLVDCIEDQTTGDHTATLLPVLTNRSPEPTTPELKAKAAPSSHDRSSRQPAIGQ